MVQQELVTCGTLFTQEVVNAGAKGSFKNMIFPAMPLENETLEMYKERNGVNRFDYGDRITTIESVD